MMAVEIPSMPTTNLTSVMVTTFDCISPTHKDRIVFSVEVSQA
jgi:hypothetical protein